MAEDNCVIYTSHSYGPNYLQKVGLWQVGTEAGKPPGQHWIVYIHGGAWRDPAITHTSLTPTINEMIKSGQPSELSIAAFASIDYRLSPRADHPQDADQVPSTDLRNACHPDHIHDVHEALRYLKKNCGMPEDYILMGHSAGAMLAFQLLMESKIPSPSTESISTPLPIAILGLSGIYDLEGLDRRHEGYTSFITSAFGEDKKTWATASPAHYKDGFRTSWAKGKLVILAWSPEDTLVDEPEIDSMAGVLSNENIPFEVDKRLRGEHDFIWQDGSQLSILISNLLKKLQQ